MKTVTGAIGIVVVVVLSALTVVAQEPASDPWAVSAGVNAQYTDNRDGVDGEKESNLDLTGEVRGDLRWRDGDRTRLNLFLAPSVKWHSNPRTTEEGNPQNDEELFGSLGFDLKHAVIPRVGIDLSDTLTYTDDPEVTVGGASVRQSANHWMNSAKAGVGAEVTPKVGTYVSGKSVIKRYDEEEVANEQDEDILEAEAYLKYLMGSGVNVFGMIGLSDFSNESQLRERGSQVATYGVGAEKIFSPDFTGKVVGGYQTAEYDDGELDSLDSMHGSAEVTLRAASPTRVRLGGLYGFYAPYVRPYSVQKLSSFWGAVDHDVTGRLTVTLKGQVSDGDYEEESAELPGGSDQMGTVSLRGKFQMDRIWALSAGYTYETWDSDVRESFERNVVDVGVGATF